MNRIKHVLAALLGSLMIPFSCFLCPVHAESVSDEAQVGWDGSVDTSWYDSQDSEFHIFSAEELAGLAYLVNNGKKDFTDQTVYLENDVDLSGANWTPIGLDADLCFCGTFDGNGFAIKNLNYKQGSTKCSNVGFFGYTAGKIQNVSLDNCTIESIPREGAYTVTCGGIVGELKNGQIERCNVSGMIVAGTKQDYATVYSGGIVGEILGECSIKDCHMDGSIKIGEGDNYYPLRDVYAGGICGYQAGEGIVEECSSDVSVFAHTSGVEYAAYVGGICGASKGTLIIKDCYSLGTASSDNVTTDLKGNVYQYGGEYAGGVIGFLSGKSQLENVYNSGKVYAAYSGGVVSLSEEGAMIKNAYYMTSTADVGVNTGNDVAIAKSVANMKKEEFANSLGESFVYVDGAYPKLRWELESSSQGSQPALENMSVGVGESIQITITNYSGQITWASSDTEILKISSDGVATGVKPGSVSVIAILESGKALTGTVEVIGTSEVIKGDVNNDGKYNIKDVIVIQKWILAIPNTYLENWVAADLNDDGVLDVFDLALMKRALLANK